MSRHLIGSRVRSKGHGGVEASDWLRRLLKLLTPREGGTGGRQRYTTVCQPIIEEEGRTRWSQTDGSKARRTSDVSSSHTRRETFCPLGQTWSSDFDACQSKDETRGQTWK